MENTIKNHISASDVNYELIKNTFSKIEEYVNFNGYQFKDQAGFEEITETSFKSAINDLSKKKRKKLAAYIWAVSNHPTLSGINKFFHFFMKNIMKSELRIRVIKSEKEIAIQEKRKVYKQALVAMKKAQAEYKAEKGDFYKIRLSKNQAI